MCMQSDPHLVFEQCVQFTHGAIKIPISLELKHLGPLKMKMPKGKFIKTQYQKEH